MRLYEDRTAPIVARVADLLGRMTLDEKVGQLNQRLHGWELYRRDPESRSLTLTTALDDEIARFGGIGAIYGLQRADPWSGRTVADGIDAEEGAAFARQVQERVRSRSRLGIPALFVEEMPHGLQSVDGTVLPVDLAAASSWDPVLVHDAGRAAGRELRARGGHVALVSGADVLRDPRWGRSEETYGEDPFLASQLVDAAVRGAQGGTGPGDVFAADCAAVVLKHVAGQGATVGGRNWAATEIGWRELYEIHLPPVRAGIEAGVAGVMAAYSELDGVPCAASRELLTDVLRGQLGFTGLVMADGQALDRLVRLTGDRAGAAAVALRAGTDLSLWDDVFPCLGEAVRTGRLDVNELDVAVARVLSLKFRLGLFDETERPDGTGARVDVARTREAAGRLAAAGVTLLSGRGSLLPLTDTRLAVVGPHAGSFVDLLGDYTAEQRVGAAESLVTALRNRVRPGTVVEHVLGARFDGASDTLDAAVAAAARADTTVLALGGSSSREDATFDANGAARTGDRPTSMTCGEGVDLASLSIGAAQLQLLREVARVTDRLVVVVVGGRPHVLTEVLETAGTVLHTFYPGIMGGEVLADILLGRREALGHLPVTLPRRSDALPVFYNHKDHPMRGYVDLPEPALLPFGSGQADADLWIQDVEVERGAVTVRDLVQGARLVCRVVLGNRGEAPAAALLQLYLRRTTAESWPRVRELRAFARVEVVPGMPSVHEFTVGARELEQVVRDGAGYGYGLAPGLHELHLGLSSRTSHQVSIEVGP